MSLEDAELDSDADEGSTSEEPEDETVAYGETDEWGGNDLESAYRKALEANDAVDRVHRMAQNIQNHVFSGDPVDGEFISKS